MTSKRIAIIGAGNSGIGAFNACQEQGLSATVFEMTDQICGQWLYREEAIEGCSSVYRSLTCNSNKEMTAFSTFPPPKNFPNYMPHSKMAEYINMFANRIGFRESVKLKHQVINCEPNDDYEESGKWKLTVKDLDNGRVVSDVFDGVMVCTGQTQKKYIPPFEGMDSFKGKIIHSHEYKDPGEFENKNVLVVGLGISAADIAVELSDKSKKVYLSIRSGAWLTARVGPWGYPFDYFCLRRAFFTLPQPILNFVVEFYSNFKNDHKLYGIKAKHRFFDQLPLFSEFLPMKLLTEQVVIKAEIERFTEKGVIFKGEKEETLCEAVVLATGYRREFPFLEESVFKPNNFVFNRDYLDVYENQFIPHLKHPKTFCFIGLVLSLGSVLPVAELQSRWFALVMADKVKLPNQKKLWEKAKQKKKWVEKNFPEHRIKYLDNHFIPLMDCLAKKIDAKPNLFKYFITDPKLWFKLYFGPCLPYQYRLQGPNKWPEAREAILTAPKRITGPLKTRINKKV